ncbi:restriction endonuclease subunit S [bacterium]|nr:restriction endonuclease subunit S [bacterium]
MKKESKGISSSAVSREELPQGWSLAKISTLVHLVNGRAFKPSEWETSGLPIVRIQNLNNPEASFNYSTNKFNEKFLIDSGTLVFAWSGTPGTSFGAHIWKGGKAWLNQHIFKVVFDENLINKKYLRFAINQNLNEYINNAHGGAGLAHITKGKFDSSEIPLPPLAEQHRIVAKIEELFSDLDAGIASLKQAQAQLKTYRQAVLKYAFEGKLTAAWREQNKPEPAEKLLAQIKAEREKQYQQKLAEWQKASAESKNKKKPPKPQKPKESSPLTEAKLAELPQLPEEWIWGTVGEIASSMKNGIYKPKEIYSESGIACLRMYNIDNGRILWFDIKRMNLEEKEIDEYELKPGDLLVNRVNSRELVGKTALIPKTMERSVYESKNIRLRLTDRFVGAFVNYWFLLSANAFFNRNAQQTVGMASINQDQLGKMPLPICSLTEQHQIVQEIESRLSVCDKLEESIKESLHKAEALRQSILKMAFEGKLVPQNPNDEPAEKLLERIRADKS